MRTKKEVKDFLDTLQWKRMSIKELKKVVDNFFGKHCSSCDGTCTDCKDIDYTIVFTTASEPLATNNFIDIEIYYLKMRNREILITGTELLDYVE